MPKLINIRELSAHISIPVSTIYQWTRKDEIPHVKMPGKSVRFDVAAIEKWLKQRTINVTV
jgi:excisionase family DNA binding protein